MKKLVSGIGVLVAWAVWPPLFYVLYWFANVLLATGRRCSIEGCTFPSGPSWIAALVIPPAVITYKWLRSLRSRGAA